MKIKISGLKITDNNLIIDINEAELDLPLNEVKEILELNIANKIKFDIEPITVKNILFYSYEENKFEEIRLHDKVEILPSENCVRNGDTIKYDERIDGLKEEIIGIDYEKNIIKLSTNILVHPYWLKLIKKNILA